MIVLTSLCGDDGNALKHGGIQLENINLLLATIINKQSSVENVKSERDAESGKAFDLQQGMSLLYHIAPVTKLSFTLPPPPIILSSLFPLFIFRQRLHGGRLINSSSLFVLF